MSRVQILEFSPGHLDVFESDKDEPTLYEDLAVMAKNPMFTLYTIFKGKKILGIAGVGEYRKGIGEVWICPDKNFCNHTYSFIKASRHLIDWCFRERKFTRLQAAIQSGDNVAQHWINKLGFKLEGLMHKWSNDNDYFLYARVE